MVEDKNLTDKLCIEKVSKKSSSSKSKSNSSGIRTNCGDNARKVQHLITIENRTEFRPFQFGVGEKKLQEITVIGTDQTNNQNSLNVNSTIDSRACYKPEKKVITFFALFVFKQTKRKPKHIYIYTLRVALLNNS